MDQLKIEKYTPELKANLINDLKAFNKLSKWCKKIQIRIEKNIFELSKIQNETSIINGKQTVYVPKQPQKTKMETNLIQIQLQSFKNIKRDDKLDKYIQTDDIYEQKYERKYHDVFLFGENLSKFKTIYERIDEINRCVGVKNLEMVLPILDKQSKMIKYKLRVKSYEDYKKLMIRWPQDSFETGVFVKSKPIELKIFIHGVKKNLKINQISSIVKEITENYGIFNIKRL
ncbi:unnamed protein product [Brachionus calyciflorus]|uniref:Uncharacterized protein n=1 Tax=Brachionus calyciflorus TaxID=104777 RepID=A0A813N4C0_9BILA|nr:unnamed protein product [Brachionus calyciflorus]